MKINVLERINGKMQSVTRDMTASEEAEFNASQTTEPTEPTAEERLEALEDALAEMMEAMLDG